MGNSLRHFQKNLTNEGGTCSRTYKKLPILDLLLVFNSIAVLNTKTTDSQCKLTACKNHGFS